MDDGMARASFHALRALVDGLRDAGVLTQNAIEAIEARTDAGIHAASVIEACGVGFGPDEAAVIRHAMWWLRECIAPTAYAVPGQIREHPKDLHDWLPLAQRQHADKTI